jgi:hypothetical protein
VPQGARARSDEGEHGLGKRDELEEGEAEEAGQGPEGKRRFGAVPSIDARGDGREGGYERDQREGLDDARVRGPIRPRGGDDQDDEDGQGRERRPVGGALELRTEGRETSPASR